MVQCLNRIPNPLPRSKLTGYEWHLWADIWLSAIFTNCSINICPGLSRTNLKEASLFSGKVFSRWKQDLIVFLIGRQSVCRYTEPLLHLLIVSTVKLKTMPAFTRMCVRDWELQYLRCSNANISQSLSIDSYMINMDPLKGAGAWMLPQGPRGHRVKSKKSNVDPLDQYWLNFCYLQQPYPPHQCFQPQHVSIWLSDINWQLWHLLTLAERKRHGDQRWALRVSLQQKKDNFKKTIYFKVKEVKFA